MAHHPANDNAGMNLPFRLPGAGTCATVPGMEHPRFRCEMDVRDYECDLQGIVNNARYQHYLEHARHLYLREQGLDFARLTAEGVILIVTRIEIDYKYPLRSGDRFTVELDIERISHIRFVFLQEIQRADGRLIARARVTTAAMNEKGRPIVPKALEPILPMKTPS